MWDILSESDIQILYYFVHACQLLSTRMLSQSAIEEAYEYLLKVTILIESTYEQYRIIPNMHLALHIKECCLDYSPLYAFWCFSYE